MVIVIGSGLALGWRPHLSLLGGAELVCLVLLGLLAPGRRAARHAGRSSDSMQGLGFAIVFPLCAP